VDFLISKQDFTIRPSHNTLGWIHGIYSAKRIIYLWSRSDCAITTAQRSASCRSRSKNVMR